MAQPEGLWLGADISADEARLVAIDPRGHVVDVRRLLDPPTPESICAGLAVLQARARDPILAVGLAHADPVVALAIATAAEKALGVPAVSAGPATSLALHEARSGCLQGVRDAVLLDVGMTLGLGVLVDGRALHLDGRDPDIAHLSIDSAGPLCSCGGRGCLVTYLGPQALSHAAQLAQLPLHDSGAGGSTFDLGSRAQRDDPLARALLAEAADAAARALQHAVRLFGAQHAAMRWPGAAPDSTVVALLQARLQRWLPDLPPLRIALAQPVGVARGAALRARQVARFGATLRGPAHRPSRPP